MATKQVKKKRTLTVEERLERIERGLLYLSAKLKTHGIHLAPDSEPEVEEVEGE